MWPRIRQTPQTDKINQGSGLGVGWKWGRWAYLSSVEDWQEEVSDSDLRYRRLRREWVRELKQNKEKKKKHVEKKLRLWLVFFTKNSTKVALHNPCLLGLDFGLAVQNISFCALFPLPLRQPFYLIGGPLQTQGLYSLVLGLLCWLAGRTVRAVWYIKNIFFL